MANPIAAVSALLLSVGLFQVANGLFISLLGVRLGQEPDISPEVAGLVLSGYFMGQVLGCIFCGRIIDRVGHVRTFAALISIVSAASMAHAYLVDPIFWWVLRLLVGFCIAGAFMVAESWLNWAADNKTRGQLLSLYLLVQFAALGGSQYLLHLAGANTFILYGFVSIVFSLSLVPLTLARTGSNSNTEVAQSALSFLQLYKISPLGMVGSFGSGILVGSVFAGGTVYGAAVGFTVNEVAQFISFTIFGSLLVQYPLGKLSDFMDRRTVLSWSVIAAGGAALVIAVVPMPFNGFLAMAAVYGGISSTLYSISIAHTNDFIDPVDLVPASAGLLLAFGVGAALGPIGATALLGAIGPSGFYLFGAIVSFAVGGFGFWRMTQRAAPSMEDQGAFVVAPRSSPVAAELDPRSEFVEDEEEAPNDDGEDDDQSGDTDPMPEAAKP